jgi:hypothetical protein
MHVELEEMLQDQNEIVDLEGVVFALVGGFKVETTVDLVASHRSHVVFLVIEEQRFNESLQMNDENKIFLLGGSEELKVTEEMYTDGTKGIKVTYLIKQDMKNVYITLRNSILRENFATTSATRANIGAILMAENDNTIYKTYLQVVKSGETKVNISILNK